MIVGVVTDFEMTFTCDLFKIAWQNNCFQSFNTSKKKWQWASQKIQVSDSGPSWPSCHIILQVWFFLGIFLTSCAIKGDFALQIRATQSFLRIE